jgi:N-acetylglucosamine kinase-like BadF-type ATPase
MIAPIQLTTSHNAKEIMLGVDGGNSKTIAIIARRDGTILGSGRAGCSDIYGAPSVSDALVEIERAIAAARADIEADIVVAGAFSLAGADWPEDINLLKCELESRQLAQRVEVMNDAFGALRAGSPDGTGVAVVCGTGAAIGARARDGRLWHSSWWQEPQGSRQLAEKALRAIVRSELGIDRHTSMTGRALATFGYPSVEDLLHVLTRRERAGRPNHAALASILLDEAENGDATASAIVSEHGAALGDFALAAARRAGLSGTAFRLILAGGVFRASGTLLRRSLCDRVLRREPLATPVAPCFEPAVGALLLAFDAAGIAVDAAVQEQLRASMPAAALFATAP